jgi:Amidohydrolase family
LQITYHEATESGIDDIEHGFVLATEFNPEKNPDVCPPASTRFLGEEDRIGTLAPGKQADLVVVRGDPSSKISDIEALEIVFKDGLGYDFKDGLGYDPAKLIDSVRGLVGVR